MTTKSKTMKTRRPKPAPAIPEKPREVSEICTLVSRWKWLEADREYQVEAAATRNDSDRLSGVHLDEQKKIETRLAGLAPKSMEEIDCLLKFAADRAEDGDCVAEGTEFEMLRNIHANFWAVLRAEKDKACKEAVGKAEAAMRHKVRCSIESTEWFEAQMAEVVDKFHAEQASRKAA